MLPLIAAALIWAFSFGLIKGHLTGIDPSAVAFIRLALAALVFAPWLGGMGGAGRRLRLGALGALQFGLMYVLYISSYAHLPAYAVALFTVTTPLYVVWIDDLVARRHVARHAAAAALAVAGAALVVWKDLPAATAWPGILLLQGANICFAVGQLGYRRWAGDGGDHRGGHVAAMAWMYLGAAVFTGVVAGAGDAFADIPALEARARWVLLYLGVLPTGVAFYLWNRGAARVGTGVLAAANNLKIPLAVFVAWTVFGERAAFVPTLAGLAAVLVAIRLARSGN